MDSVPTITVCAGLPSGRVAFQSRCSTQARRRSLGFDRGGPVEEQPSDVRWLMLPLTRNSPMANSNGTGGCEALGLEGPQPLVEDLHVTADLGEMGVAGDTGRQPRRTP